MSTRFPSFWKKKKSRRRRLNNNALVVVYTNGLETFVVVEQFNQKKMRGRERHDSAIM